ADFGFLARCRALGSGSEHNSKFLQAVFKVASLVAIPLAGHDQLSFRGQAACIFGQESFAHLLGQTCTGRYRPGKNDLAFYFFDFLPAGSAATGIRELEFLERYFKARTNRQMRHLGMESLRRT